MSQKIVVFGGSFNPPTVAHKRLLSAALDGVGADRGIFVPSNDAYVTKKMGKTDYPSEVLSERTRAAMLNALCAGDGRLSVDEGEYGYSGTSGNSLDTMKRVQANFPEAERLYFLFGGDKLKTFSKWKTFREFCESYKIVVFRREGFDPGEEIERTKALREVRDTFVILPAPEGIDGISSTAVRDAVRGGDDERAGSMLTPEVFALLTAAGSPIHKETAITSFRGRYAFLSNFHAAPVTFEGMTFPTNEAAFQAAKCLDPDDRVPFTETKNPVLVKRMGRKVTLRSDWEFVKLGIMEKIVRAKFGEHPELAAQLVATGDLPIMEGNSWHDTFWGVDASTGRGENHLGRILMKVRKECGGAGDTSADTVFPAAPAPRPGRTATSPVSGRSVSPSVSRSAESGQAGQDSQAGQGG
ncbi:MAG: DUF1768 domain-containing protein [Clostridia bacterium]|nr:DUF1768 domain-containing protein [Clostridia bacterium]